MHSASWISKRHQREDQQEDEGKRPKKRRARYALRACNECKRRKGRCDGHIPCEYCRRRSLQCHYDREQGLLPTSACAPISPKRVASEAADGERALVSEIERISSMVETMRTQIDTLVRLAKPMGDEHNQTHRHTACEYHHCAPRDVRSATSQRAPFSPRLPGADPGKSPETRYCGASSSDYSLNVAEICIQPTQRQSFFEDLGSSSKRPPCLIAERTNIDECFTSRAPGRVPKACFCNDCTQSLRMIDKDTALRLANEYQGVVGVLYPILDIENLISQMRDIYTALDLKRPPENTRSQIDSENINILKIVLAVALRMQTIAESGAETALYASVQESICYVLTSQVRSSSTVILMLLMGIYHFFRDEIRVAWRLCGIAGRLAMELGLHRRYARLHLTVSEKEPREFINMMWTIVILDQQWSCETGLPQNFQDTDFAESLQQPMEAPYLKAMISYASFGPHFWDSTNRTTATDVRNDEDTFDFLNFQVEQWRKRSLTGLPFVHPNNHRASPPGNIPQYLPTLLYLRANQLQGLLVRSYFLSDSTLSNNGRIVASGTGVFCDTIDVLCDLDATTDLYRTQHPVFHHFLASSVALMFLIIASESKKEFMSAAVMLERLSSIVPNVKISESISRAYELAATYYNISSSSRRLWMRMELMKKYLSKLGLAPRLISHTPACADPVGRGQTLSDVDGEAQVSSLNDRSMDQSTVKPREFDTRRVRSPVLTAAGGISDVFDNEAVFTMVPNTPRPAVTEAELNVFDGLESSLDGQTWEELSFLFSQDPL